MRNLAQYPVTKVELLAYLYSLLDDYQEEIKNELVCGDMTGVLLCELIRIVEETRHYTFKMTEYEEAV